jgi:hypothetical protein
VARDGHDDGVLHRDAAAGQRAEACGVARREQPALARARQGGQRRGKVELGRRARVAREHGVPCVQRFGEKHDRARTVLELAHAERALELRVAWVSGGRG